MVDILAQHRWISLKQVIHMTELAEDLHMEPGMLLVLTPRNSILFITEEEASALIKDLQELSDDMLKRPDAFIPEDDPL